MINDSHEREKQLWGLIFALGTLVILHQVARAVISSPEEFQPLSAEEMQTYAFFEPDAFLPDPQPQPEPVVQPASITHRRSSELLVESIILVESAGNPRCVGQVGERGLMQIRRGTWRDVTRRWFGDPLPFDKAFDPELNRFVGRAYLSYLQAFLREHKAEWQDDERSLLLACYNAGPNKTRSVGFSVKKLPKSTRSYVKRASALHTHFVRQELERRSDVQLTETDAPPSNTRGPTDS